MKIIVLLVIITAIFIVVTGMINKSTAKTETQKYSTLYKQGDFEIRFYPEASLASVNLNGTYDDSRNSGFRILAGYIFGGNKSNRQIAMTSPVRMTSSGENSTMSFVLPSGMDFENLPEPVNGRVMLHRSKPVYTAVIRYGGYTGNREIEAKKAELTAWLSGLGLKWTGNFEYLGYNPPYQMINRRNEVLVELHDFTPGMLPEIVANR